MSKKPRQKHLGKAWVRIEDKSETIIKKKSKPWKAREVKERGTFDNVTLSDLKEGFTNRTNAKRFSRHKFIQRME